MPRMDPYPFYSLRCNLNLSPFIAPRNSIAKLLVDLHRFLRPIARIILQIMHRTPTVNERNRPSDLTSKHSQSQCGGADGLGFAYMIPSFLFLLPGPLGTSFAILNTNCS